MKIKNLIMLLFFFYTALSSAANLDCNNVKSAKYPQEKLYVVVCSRPELTELYLQDEGLFVKLYSLASSEGVLSGAFSQQRFDWTKNLSKTCNVDGYVSNQVVEITQLSVECVKNLYMQRAENLTTMLKNGFYINGRKKLPISTSPPNKDIADNAEILFVSGYSPVRAEGKVNVVVDRPNKAVLLVLSSYESTLWELDATASTNIKGIILGVASEYKSQVASALNVPVYKMAIDGISEVESINFQRSLQVLHDSFGIDALNYFQGSYEIPKNINIQTLPLASDNLTLAGPIPSKINNVFNFDLTTTDFKKVKWSLNGSLAANYHKDYVSKGVVFNTDSSTTYKLIYNEIEVNNSSSGTFTLPSMPTEFPKFFQLRDIAFDSKRNILAVINAEFSGYLYRFDIKNNKWLDYHRIMLPMTLSGLSYDLKTDRYVSFGGDNDRKPHLIFLSGDGEFIAKENVSSLLPGFGRLYNSDTWDNIPKLVVIPQGNDIALIQKDGSHVSRIWYYNFETKKAALTYKDHLLFAEEEKVKAVVNKKEAQNKPGTVDALDENSFLEANKTKAGVQVTASGLQYKVIVAGTGIKPKVTDTVSVYYIGKLINGVEFDSSQKHGSQPVTFEVGGVIPGWTEALQLMPQGSKWELFIPSVLAYGPLGSGPVPPASTLIMEIELLAVKTAAEAKK